MDPRLPPGWKMFSNVENGEVIYLDPAGQLQSERPVVAGFVHDPSAPPPSAPPIHPMTKQVQTKYYPHIPQFSTIPHSDIIDMLYHPSAPPDLTLDDVDLIINNYVGTDIKLDRKSICGDDTDILSCAKKLFMANANVAKDDYSFKLPIQPASYWCDISFRWNPHNRGKETLDKNQSAYVVSKLFPLNDNTVRWLCSTPEIPFPSMSMARENKFMLDYFCADYIRASGYRKTPIQVATETRDYMLSPEYKQHQQLEIDRVAKERKEVETKQRVEELRKYTEQRKLDGERRDAERVAERKLKQSGQQKCADAGPSEPWSICRMGGGLKQTKRKQAKRKQAKRKQTKRKQAKRKQAKRIFRSIIN